MGALYPGWCRGGNIGEIACGRELGKEDPGVWAQDRVVYGGNASLWWDFCCLEEMAMAGRQ